MQRTQEFDYIGKNILRVRNELGVSQKELARRAGVGAASISKVEKGRSTSAISIIVKLAIALGVPVSLLVDNEEQYSTKQAVFFYKKFGGINHLPGKDQLLIKEYIDRLRRSRAMR